MDRDRRTSRTQHGTLISHRKQTTHDTHDTLPEKHEHIWRGRNRYSSGNRSCARRSSDPPLQKRQSQSRQIQRVRHSRHVHVGIEMAPPPAARCASGCKAVRCYLRQSQTHGRVSVKRGAPEGRRLRGPQGGTGARACSSGPSAQAHRQTSRAGTAVS